MLEIRATDAGAPAPHATIELVFEPESGAAAVTLHTSDEAGALALALGRGTVRAAGWTESATALPVHAKLVPGETTELALALEPAFPVAGRVIDARSGVPLAGAEVAIWTFAERDVVTTGPDGSFVHPRFPAHAPAQQIVARAAGHGTSVRYLRIDGDGAWKLLAAQPGTESMHGTGTPWLELELPPALRVRGRVVVNGQPVAGARVAAEGFYHALASVAARDAREVLTDESGTFELDGLRADVGHSLVVDSAGSAMLTRELPADATELDLGALELVTETVLAGVVVDGDGVPLVDVEVVLRAVESAPAERGGAGDVGARIQGREQRTRTDANGTFLFERLAAAPVRLTATGDSATWEGVLAPRADGTFLSPCVTLVATRTTVALRAKTALGPPERP